MNRINAKCPHGERGGDSRVGQLLRNIQPREEDHVHMHPRMRDPNRAEARCAEQGLQVSFPRGLALAGGAPPTGDGVCQAGRRPSPSSQIKNSGAVGKREVSTTQREGPWGTPTSRFVLALRPCSSKYFDAKEMNISFPISSSVLQKKKLSCGGLVLVDQSLGTF